MNKIIAKIGSIIVTVAVILFVVFMVTFKFGSYFVCMFLALGYLMMIAGFHNESDADRRVAANVGLNMIRRLQKADIDSVADIWLNTNLKAHCFIPAQYWKDNFEMVKEMLSQAEVYLYEDGQKIQGFIGISGEYIEGIFVSDEMQSRGIGRLLLDYIKDKKLRLCLNVYQKNTRAIKFYQREGFRISGEGIDEATGEKDYVMVWQRK